jgi:phospholipid N-methyltransferase
MSTTIDTSALIEPINKRIKKYRDEAAALLNSTISGSPTAKRVREQEKRFKDGQRLRTKAEALEGYRDALATGTLPPKLLGMARITELALEHIVFDERWPVGEWNQSIRTALNRSGIVEDTYTDRRNTFLALAAPPDVAGDVAIQIKKREAAILPGSIDGYFPTPPPVIERMLEHAEIHEGDIILEPSAGGGAILDAIRARWADAVDLYACECNRDLHELLELKGYRFPERIGWDFMDGGPYDQDMRYDRIIGNPPFEKGQDMQHIMRAYQYLGQDGLLVMICSEGPFFRSDKAAVQFRLWLSEVGAETERLPEGAFKASGTGVACRIVIIYK